MKKTKAIDFPFVTDKDHIYNLLVDNEIHGIDVGWGYFEFELHSNLKNNDESVDGLTEFYPKKIKLEMDLDDEYAREILIHEILHVVLETLGLDERNFEGGPITTTNELLANSVAKQFILIKNLNPKLMELVFNDRTIKP